MNTRYNLIEEVEAELAELSAPKVSKPEPKNEADKTRQWLASLDLDNMQNNDIERAELYKYEVGIMRGEKVFYLFTRSPQQKSMGRRSLGTTNARGDKEAISQGIERFISQMEAKAGRRTAQRDAKRQARAEFVNPYKVGDFLYSSWGYEQTNREFYQVIEVGNNSLKIQEVAQNRTRDGYDSGHCSPIRDSFVKPAQWVTIQVATTYHSVPSPIHGNLYAYEGKPVYFSDGY
jgi:hypothetical protein